MSLEELYDAHDAVGLATLVRDGAIGAQELLEEAITRVARINPTVNAVVTTLNERARNAVRRGLPAGPFTGVPFLLKDLGQPLAGEVMSCGSRFLAGYVPAVDSEMVRRFQASGTVIFGKTNTPEFGLVGSTEPRLFGPTRNPWDATRTAGGSSGGAAAAVAAGIVPMAAAADGGGSIRIPAACCGLVGLKPSRGRNPSGPLQGEPWYGQVQDGVISRSVRDTAVMLDATAGGDPGMPYGAPPPTASFASAVARPPPRLRIAVCDIALCGEAALDPVCLDALATTAAHLEQLGHHVEYAAPRLERMALGTGYLLRVLACTAAELHDAARQVGRPPRTDEVELTTRAFARLAGGFDAVDLTLANRAIEREMRKLGQFMQGYDVMLTPTLAQPPAPLGVFEPRGTDRLLAELACRLPLGSLPRRLGVLEQFVHNNFRFVVSTMIANLSGEPAISLPLTWSAEGLPIGMMFSAPLYGEETLLALAGELERSLPWSARRAPLHA